MSEIPKEVKTEINKFIRQLAWKHKILNLDFKISSGVAEVSRDQYDYVIDYSNEYFFK